jgi:transcriptional regulator with XRE-family HTH domain
MEKMSLKEFRVALGQKIKERREELGLSQPELGVLLGGKDKQTVSRYEIEGANPTIYNFIKLAEALDLDIRDLLDFKPKD